MTVFESGDGTRLAYHQAGEGDPLICLPGGPMQASAYLGDLGGLSVRCSLVLLDLRGTGESAVPADPGCCTPPAIPIASAVSRWSLPPPGWLAWTSRTRIVERSPKYAAGRPSTQPAPDPPSPAYGRRSFSSRPRTSGSPPTCAAEYAGLFSQASLTVQPGGGHFPWLDNPEWFLQTLTGFFR